MYMYILYIYVYYETRKSVAKNFIIIGMKNHS